jgi:uncharacterized protein with PIN domain
MAKCPNCKKELAKPDKKIETHAFRIEVYSCDSCGISFKVVR